MRSAGSAFFFAALLLYSLTAAPSVATIFDDSLEFQVVLPTLGIAHPSGYPLYTLLGKAFTLLLPFRDPAGRANLLSALCAAGAVGLLYAAGRKMAGSSAAAAIAAASFALSAAWWSQAAIAEVYALHGLLVALFLYLMLRWEEAISPFLLPNKADRWLALAAFVAGLGLAHHRMIALLLPAALVFVFWTDRSLLRAPRRWLRPLACGLAPLLLYLYLPIRGQAVGSLDGAFRPTLAGALDWVTAAGYSVFLTGNPFEVSRDAAFFYRLFQGQLGGAILAAAGLGLLTAWRFGLRRYALLLLATAGQVAFGVAYKVQDVEVFFTPAFMLAALWAAQGLTLVFDWGAAWLARLGGQLRLPARGRPWIIAGCILLAAALVLAQPVAAAVRDFDRLNRSRDWGVYDHGQDMLAHVATGGQVVGLLGETTLLRYFRDVLGQRPDVMATPADAEPARLAAVDAALAAGRPVYLTRDLPGAAARYSLDAAGPLIAVSPKAQPASVAAGQTFGVGIVLVDAVAEVRRVHAGPVVRVTLVMAAGRPAVEELKVSARLLNAAGERIAQADAAPVHFAYPAPAWVPGETVRDVYDLALPPNAPSGSYGLLAILYRAASGSEVGRVQLPAVTVPDRR